MKETRLIYADGSSLGNPGPGGFGVVIAKDGRVIELGGGAPHTTNNKMELTAAIEALSHIHEKKKITLRTDSSYLVNGITKWVAGWERERWRGVNKKEIQNKELWKKLVKAAKGKEILWEYVPGHAGIPGNERADAIATRCAKEGQFRKKIFFDGPLARYPYDIFTAAPSKKKVSKKRTTAKAYSYLSLVTGVPARHATWAECEARVSGVSGATCKKAFSPEDEERILKAWGVHPPKL